MLRVLLSKAAQRYRRAFSLDLERMVVDFAIPRGGVLHVGGNKGQEAASYDRLGFEQVIWIEGMPEFHKALVAAIAAYPKQKAFQLFAGNVDRDEVVINVADTEGATTLMTPNVEFSGISFIRQERHEARRLDVFFEEQGCDLSALTLLVLDIEGYELRALLGLGDKLRQFPWVLCEISIVPNYVNGPTLSDVDRFMEASGYVRSAIWVGRYSGDALYRRQDHVGVGAAVHHRLSALGYKIAYRLGLLDLKTSARNLIDGFLSKSEPTR